MFLYSLQKWDLCVSLLFAHVLEVGTPTLKAHLNALQEVGAHPLRGVCWHFTHVLPDTRTQLPQATGLAVVSSVLLTVRNSTHWTRYWSLGACKGNVYRNKPSTSTCANERETHISHFSNDNGNINSMEMFP